MSAIHNGLQNLRPVNNNDTLFARARNYGYYPLISNDNAPSFYLPADVVAVKKPLQTRLQREVNISIDDYLDKPLVVTFFNTSNGNIAEQIKNLESLRADIKVMGGRLIVLTAIPLKYLRTALRNYENLVVVYDKDNEIASQFGLYDAANPLWQWVSGVESEDAALPALYVISPDRKIIYHHIDYNLSLYADNNYYARTFMRELLTAVYTTAQQYTYQPIQYRSVS